MDCGERDFRSFHHDDLSGGHPRGLVLMPEGRRRSALETAAYALFSEDFGGRVLPFDAAAASAYAEIFAARRRRGRPTAPLDLMIAAIALAHGACVVTWELGGFEDCGVTLIDPWQVWFLDVERASVTGSRYRRRRTKALICGGGLCLARQNVTELLVIRHLEWQQVSA